MMKRLLALLLLTALLFCASCTAVKQAADVLGSDEAKERIEDGWDVLTDEIDEGVQKGKARVGDALDKVLPDTAQGYTLGGADLAANAIREIEVDWVSGAVDIAVYDGDTISFSEASAGALTEKQRLRYRVEEDELRIVCCEKSVVNLPHKTLTLRIPAALALESVEVDLVSAELTVADVQAGEIDAKTVSGHTTLRGVSCRELEVKSVSGLVTLESCAVASEISIETVSGEAVIQLPPETTGFSLAFHTVSGKLECAREVRVADSRLLNGDGGLEIKVDSVSGNLAID